MFRVTIAEFKNLIFQNGISSWGGTRKMPYVFTEQGVAMLSSVLNSKRAIAVNIHIVRVFARMRQMMLTHKDILLRIETLEKQVVSQNGKLKKHEQDIQIIFRALKELLNPKPEPSRSIGFRRKEES